MEKPLIVQGYSLVIDSYPALAKKLEIHVLEHLAKSNVDGMSIVTGSITKEDISKYAQDIPVVAVDYDMVADNVRSINIDNVLCGYMATLHLPQQGHVNIAHIKGLSSQPDAGNRFEGYKKALQEAGIKVMPKLLM